MQIPRRPAAGGAAGSAGRIAIAILKWGYGMRNDWFKTSGEIKIALKRGGRKGTEYVWVSIDRADFKLVDSYPGSWVAKWNPTAQTFYARNNAGYGWKAGYMHRLILGVTDRKIQIDHKDHNGLHNWRDNLIRSDVKLNGFNRRGAERGSISGRRNVYWNQREQKYMVWFVHNGQRYYFGYFADIDVADRVAIAERARFV